MATRVCWWRRQGSGWPLLGSALSCSVCRLLFLKLQQRESGSGVAQVVGTVIQDIQTESNHSCSCDRHSNQGAHLGSVFSRRTACTGAHHIGPLSRILWSLAPFSQEPRLRQEQPHTYLVQTPLSSLITSGQQSLCGEDEGSLDTSPVISWMAGWLTGWTEEWVAGWMWHSA